MAINGADAIPSLSRDIRVTPVRSGVAPDTPKRDSHPSSRSAKQEPRVPPPAERRIQLPEFAGHDLSFRHDEELNRIIVQVVDSETREVVRTIPPEEVVNTLKNIRRAQGALLDEEA